MDNIHEIISFSSEIPLKIFIQHIGSSSKHWHTSIEILFVLSGEVTITVDDATMQLKPKDVIVINSNALHELYAKDSELAAFQINLTKSDFFKEYANMWFDCCSVGSTHDEKYNYLRFLLARLIKDNAEHENKLYTLSLLSLLISELSQHFAVEHTAGMSNTKKHLERLQSIRDYILNHFREGITLAQLAQSEHLSTAYLSRFFTQHFGTSFTDYYNAIRLEYAVNELLTSDESVAEIAEHNGFSDVRSFVALFKEKYHELPSNYRKQYKLKPEGMDIKQGINYFSVSTFASLANLADYLKYDQLEAFEHLEPKMDTTYVTADVLQAGTALKHYNKMVCCVGTARDILNADIQAMLRRLQNEIHYKYIKFHGMFCDDMQLFNIDRNGKPYLSFIMLDKAMDFLRSIGLMPLLQLSFMPEKLATDLNKTNFYLKYNTSPPNNMDFWCMMVRETIEHYIDRYSMEEVKQWLFCVWNEPDTSPDMFGFYEDEDFFEFYRRTYEIVKSIDSEFRFGTPSIMLCDAETPRRWDMAFFKYCRETGCIPDFINLHYYDDTIELLDIQVGSTEIRPNLLNINENAFSEFLDAIYEELPAYFGKIMPVYMTEWNLTVNHRNLINDTCFKSCYLAKNLLENYDRLYSFGYWSLSDFILEQQIPNQLFHGGLGLFTYNGVPKAPFYMFKYLARLGDTCISRGKGWFITRTKHAVQIALYNYEHYNKLYASGELFDMTSVSRYTPFSMRRRLSFHITLDHLPDGACARIREYFINQDHGSSFDTWVQMGAPKDINEETAEMLEAHSMPGLYTYSETVENGQLTIKTTLEPLEVRFIEIQM